MMASLNARQSLRDHMINDTGITNFEDFQVRNDLELESHPAQEPTLRLMKRSVRASHPPGPGRPHRRRRVSFLSSGPLVQYALPQRTRVDLARAHPDNEEHHKARQGERAQPRGRRRRRDVPVYGQGTEVVAL